MLSVVIATQESERALLPTLAALVPGAAAGLVREVLIADAGSRDATAAIADAAGCRVLSLPQPRGARLKAAAAEARAAWLLFLTAGVVLDAEWVGEAAHLLEESESQEPVERRAAVFRPGLAISRSLWSEALFLLRVALRLTDQAVQGLLIDKQLYERLGGHRVEAAEPERDLARRLGRRRIVVLRCGIRMSRPAPANHLTSSTN